MAHKNFSVHIPIPPGRVKLGGSWWVVAPALLVVVGAVYVPILGPFLGVVETWGLAVGITILAGVSLLVHAWAHAVTAGATGCHRPAVLSLYLFGEAAQAWPAAPSARRETLAALAGPLANLLLAGLAYLAWDAQLHPYLNISMFFLIFFNFGLAALNLSPVFPFDGGRLLRAIMWGLLDRPEPAGRLGVRLGFLLAALLAGWGFFLILQQARFSWPTGAATLALAGLAALALRRQPAWQWDRPQPAGRFRRPGRVIRGLLAAGLLLLLAVVTLGLAPTNSGLEAPGYAVPVEPMIFVPPGYRFSPAGSFILTSILPQTPITAGQWLYGQWSPAIKIVPPERIVPAGTTAQEQARQQYRMLAESEMIAIAVGLGLAGYEVEVEGQGARVVSVLPESLAIDTLQPGDVIVRLNTDPIRGTADLISRLSREEPGGRVWLEIERNGRSQPAAVTLMPPAEADGPPRLGITVESAGFDINLPFPVEIVPQKISGGPSAGLMFALTVYNMVTPEDLTGGRKIAGTGTIDLEGRVGIIGGVEQKVVAAERAGAEIFLAPPENYEDARAVARRIRVVEVATAQEAIRFLAGLPPLQGEQ